MHLTLEIPDNLVGPLSAAGADLSRRALEALGLDDYRNGCLTKAQLRALLGFGTRYELDGFLKTHEVWINYTLDDAHKDTAMLERLGF